jgi:hypothetical protein
MDLAPQYEAGSDRPQGIWERRALKRFGRKRQGFKGRFSQSRRGSTGRKEAVMAAKLLNA